MISAPASAGSSGAISYHELITEKPGIPIEVVKDECKPRGFDYALERLPNHTTRFTVVF